jgi:hypothetical protein
MEFAICSVVSITTLDQMVLETKMYMNVGLGTLETQFMLFSIIGALTMCKLELS